MVHIDHEKKYSSFNNFKIHFNVVLFLDELYLDGENCPLQPQAHSWYISNAKLSGRRGGELSPRKLLHNLSASLRVIIPHLLKQRKIKRRSKEWWLIFLEYLQKSIRYGSLKFSAHVDIGRLFAIDSTFFLRSVAVGFLKYSGKCKMRNEQFKKWPSPGNQEITELNQYEWSFMLKIHSFIGVYLDEIGIAPALRNISSWTGVHCTQVIPSATLLLWISL